MKPIIALVGRPNVGKSTLFNQLTRTRNALVANFAGLTRDRQYGNGELEDMPFIVIDTGGIGHIEEEEVDRLTEEQSLLAVEEADIVCFMVDGRQGVVAADEEIAELLRRHGKKVHLVVNKIDGIDADSALADFYQMGIESTHAIAATHGRGVVSLLRDILVPYYEDKDVIAEADSVRGIKIALVGRPNVGKSTLTNRILGEDRVVVCDMAGTTRDSVYIPYQRDGIDFTLIDTAGVRRRGKVNETVEKFSVIKALKAIDDANVVIFVIDARDGLVEQDLHLLGQVIDVGRAVVIAVNKWDGMTHEDKDKVKETMQRRLTFIPYAKVHFISALHGTAVGDVYKSVLKAHESAFRSYATNLLTNILNNATLNHAPPMVRGRRIKLRYAHQGGKNPTIIVIHGNQTASVKDSYRRYLENKFRSILKIQGTPVRIEFKSGDNPFEGQPNKLTDRMQAKKRQLTKSKESKRRS